MLRRLLMGLSLTICSVVNAAEKAEIVLLQHYSGLNLTYTKEAELKGTKEAPENTKWKFVKVEGGWGKLINVKTGKVLGAVDAKEYSKPSVYDATSTGDDYLWKYRTEDDAGRIVHRSTKLKLHLKPDGSKLMLGPWMGKNTKWTLVASK